MGFGGDSRSQGVVSHVLTGRRGKCQNDTPSDAERQVGSEPVLSEQRALLPGQGRQFPDWAARDVPDPLGFLAPHRGHG